MRKAAEIRFSGIIPFFFRSRKAFDRGNKNIPIGKNLLHIKERSAVVNPVFVEIEKAAVKIRYYKQHGKQNDRE